MHLACNHYTHTLLLTGAYARLNSYYGKPNITLQSSSVVCEGDESALTDCKVTWVPYLSGKSASKHVDVGGVYCPPPTPPPECETPPPPVKECTNDTIRLQSNNVNNNEGLLQYCYNEQWSYFCSVDTPAATVACRQLGYKEYSRQLTEKNTVFKITISCFFFYLGATIMTDGSFGAGNQYSFIDSVTCSGSEDSLTKCSLSVQKDCLPKCSSNVAIRCYSKRNCTGHNLLFLVFLYNRACWLHGRRNTPC